MKKVQRLIEAFKSKAGRTPSTSDPHSSRSVITATPLGAILFDSHLSAPERAERLGAALAATPGEIGRAAYDRLHEDYDRLAEHVLERFQALLKDRPEGALGQARALRRFIHLAAALTSGITRAGHLLQEKKETAARENRADLAEISHCQTACARHSYEAVSAYADAIQMMADMPAALRHKAAEEMKARRPAGIAAP